MKIAIITDTHYGARKGSKHLHDYFEKFYDDVFFPALEEHGVDTAFIWEMHLIVVSQLTIKVFSGQRELYLIDSRTTRCI